MTKLVLVCASAFHTSWARFLTSFVSRIRCLSNCHLCPDYSCPHLFRPVGPSTEHHLWWTRYQLHFISDRGLVRRKVCPQRLWCWSMDSNHLHLPLRGNFLNLMGGRNQDLRGGESAPANKGFSDQSGARKQLGRELPGRTYHTVAVGEE